VIFDISNSVRRDAVVIGVGHNGLICAFYLAKAGAAPAPIPAGAYRAISDVMPRVKSCVTGLL
jgi:hypothetical protein